ncbi:hypothetical protein C8R46DRAFT_1048692 [Mycena filopes]|nr:hypothetical protein C8R46DRAFT_1048692 [Mycena filopes]
MAPSTERPTPVSASSSRAPWAFISENQAFHDIVEYFHPTASLSTAPKNARQALSNLQPVAAEFHRRFPVISDDLALFFATIRAASKRLEQRVSVRAGQPRPDFSALTAYTVPPHLKALLSAPAALEFSDDDFDDDIAPPPGKKPRRDSFQGSRASRRSPSPYEADDVDMEDPPTSPPKTRASTQASSARQASTATSSTSRAGPSHRPGTAQVEVFIQIKPPRCFNKPPPQVEQGATTRGGVYAASTSSAANTVGLNPDCADFDEPVSAVLAIPHAIVQDYFTPRLYSKVFVKCLSCVNRTNQTCVPSEGKRCGPCHRGNISCSWNHSSNQQLTSLDEIRVQYGLTADFLFNLIARAVERRRKAEVLYGLYVSTIEDVATSDLDVVLGFKSQSATLDPEVLRRYFENPRDLQQLQALAVRTTEENDIGDLYMKYEESHPTTEPQLRNEFLPASTSNSYFTPEVTGSDSWVNVAPTNKANEQIFRAGSQIHGAVKRIWGYTRGPLGLALTECFSRGAKDNQYLSLVGRKITNISLVKRGRGAKDNQYLSRVRRKDLYKSIREEAEGKRMKVGGKVVKWVGVGRKGMGGGRSHLAGAVPVPPTCCQTLWRHDSAPQLAYRFEDSVARSSPVRPRPSGRSPPVASSSQSQFGEVGGALGGGGPRRSATPVATSVARADTVPGSSPAVVLYSKSCDSFGTH